MIKLIYVIYKDMFYKKQKCTQLQLQHVVLTFFTIILLIIT